MSILINSGAKVLLFTILAIHIPRHFDERSKKRDKRFSGSDELKDRFLSLGRQQLKRLHSHD